jgi:hypothetical protein
MSSDPRERMTKKSTFLLKSRSLCIRVTERSGREKILPRLPLSTLLNLRPGILQSYRAVENQLPRLVIHRKKVPGTFLYRLWVHVYFLDMAYKLPTSSFSCCLSPASLEFTEGAEMDHVLYYWVEGVFDKRTGGTLRSRTAMKSRLGLRHFPGNPGYKN